MMNQYDNSETFFENVKYPIQCFAINNDGDKVIVAGKTQFELYSIDERQFTFKYKNSFKRAPTNLCIMDINWSKLDSSLVVSGGSNGELYKLIVGQSDITLDASFTNKFHDRTINKIHFHPNDRNLLLSGGQDGIIKLIDFRENSPVLSFRHDAEDKVTDVQFNPSHKMCTQFASGSETGSVFTWDIRFNKYERKLNQHVGNVHLDWHPESAYKLATASRDKQICIYDLSQLTDKLVPIHTITHSERVISIKWRPKRPNQITACSTGIDAHLYVWDLMRPYVPYASFDQLTNKVHNFLWRNSPKVIIASTHECLYNMNISDAIRPADYSTLVTIQMDKHGSVVFAVGVGDAKKTPGGLLNEPMTSMSTTNSISANPPTEAPSGVRIESDTRTLQNESSVYSIQQQAGSYGSLSFTMNNIFSKPVTDTQSNESDNNVEKFRITKSILYCDDHIKLTRSDWFYYAVTNYRFKEKSFEDLCDHNAQVALSFKKFNVFKDWMILKTIYKDNNKRYESKEYQALNNPLTLTLSANLKAGSQNGVNTATSVGGSDSNLSNLNIVTGAFAHQPNININNPTSSSSNSSSATSSSSTNVNTATTDMFRNFNSSRVRHFSENSNDEITCMPVPKPAELIPYFNQSTNTNVHNNTLDLNPNEDESYYFNNHNLIDRFNDEDDFAVLPSDIVEYNDDLSEDYFINDLIKNQKLIEPDTINTTNNTHNKLKTDHFKLNMIKQRAFTDYDAEKLKYQDNALLLQPVTDLKSSNEMIDNKESSFLKNISASYLSQTNLNENFKMDFSNYFQQLLVNYVNEENDLPTAVFMYLVATIHEKLDRNKIDSNMLDEWFVQFIDLLQVFELWNYRISTIKHYQSDLIKHLTQKSINYNSMCSACKKSIKPNTFVCPNCNHNIYLCAFCHLPVKRLYAWCHMCCHGGHLNHMMKWFKSNTKCPTGCGCKCKY